MPSITIIYHLAFDLVVTYSLTKLIVHLKLCLFTRMLLMTKSHFIGTSEQEAADAIKSPVKRNVMDISQVKYHYYSMVSVLGLF